MFNLAVYGTLRPGSHNHFLIPDGAIHHGEARVPGFELRILGGWLPLAVPNPDSSIVVDLFEIPTYSKGLFAIAEMEVGAGYVPATIIVNAQPYILWVYVGSTARSRLQESGDYQS